MGAWVWLYYIVRTKTLVAPVVSQPLGLYYCYHHNESGGRVASIQTSTSRSDECFACAVWLLLAATCRECKRLILLLVAAAAAAADKVTWAFSHGMWNDDHLALIA